MNENLNLVEILQDVPIGTVFFSPIFGDLMFTNMYVDIEYEIQLIDSRGIIRTFNKEGKYSYLNTECLLFPSKDQRDWSKFKVCLQEKDLVWAWNNEYPCVRVLGFYDPRYNSLFLADGNRDGLRYDNYKRYTGVWPDWAVEAYKKLKD